MSYIVFSSQDIYNMSLSKATKYLYVKQIQTNIRMDGQNVLKRNVSVAKLHFVALVYINSQKLTLS